MSVKQIKANGRVSTVSLAKTLGVSQSTVSRVLDGSYTRYRISEPTARRIRATADEAGYRPHAGALAMRTNRFNAAGVLMSEDVIRGADFLATLRGINDVLVAAGQTLSLVTLSHAEHGKPLSLQMLDVHGVDGLLIDYPAPVWAAKRVSASQLPTVWVNVNDRLEANSFCFDDELGARMATEHLIGLGHRRIAYFSAIETKHFSVARRLAGYERTMRGAGLPVDPDLHEVLAEDRCKRMVQRLSGPDRPTGVVCYGGVVALSALRAAYCLSLRVPDDLSVIGTDDSVQGVDTCPPMTVISPPRYDVGREAAEGLLRLVEDPSTQLPAKLFKPKLVVRESTAPPPQGGSSAAENER